MIQALTYLFFFSLFLIAYLRSISLKNSSKKRIYTREMFLTYQSSCTEKPNDWQPLKELKPASNQAQIMREPIFKHQRKERNVMNFEEKNKENFISSHKQKQFKKIECNENSTTLKSKTIEASENDYSCLVKQSVKDKNFSQASFYLNEMNRIGIDAKKDLIDSYLEVFNSQRKPLGIIKQTLAEASSNSLRLASLNPNAQEFNPRFK
ncbi:unnamed protein product [Blepharisma stoltei]|uniref:Uncharacterized protein n=1 Tax=Blepharisma stoltei TaxID=1481888 RepID=A0AAU9KAH5_9CILI|nr:unnamed protein product [Blepharisma stoltei]